MATSNNMQRFNHSSFNHRASSSVRTVESLANAKAVYLITMAKARDSSVDDRPTFSCCCPQSCKIPRNSPKTRTYNSSRSTKVIDLDVNGKRTCDFLLVRPNFGRIFYRFEILTFKARKWLVFPPLVPICQTLFDATARGNPLEFLDETYPAKTSEIGLP